jgi:integrase
MSDSTFNAVKKWLRFRSRYAGNTATAPLLISEGNKRLTYRQAYSAFRKVCADCGIVDIPLPRLHDLRHNYACRCIALWRTEEEDVNALLPVLSNAMGHVDFPSTQVYLHIDAAALRQASVKFNQHIKHSLGEKS